MKSWIVNSYSEENKILLNRKPMIKARTLKRKVKSLVDGQEYKDLPFAGFSLRHAPIATMIRDGLG